MRCCARGLIAGRTRGICVPCAIDVGPNNAWRRCCKEFCGGGKSGTSSMVFHAPQSGHLPTHLLCSPLHCWQMYFVRVFGIKNIDEKVWACGVRHVALHTPTHFVAKLSLQRFAACAA